jgi:hypothetical protein
VTGEVTIPTELERIVSMKAVRIASRWVGGGVIDDGHEEGDEEDGLVP